MKTFATVALAALLAGSGTYAFAQQQNPAPNAPTASQDQGQQNRRPRMSQDDYNRLVDARIAAIKAGLKLSADQERLWGPVETAIRTSAADRYARMQQFRENRDQRRSMDLMQRLEQRSTMLNQSAQRSAALTTALRPLWDSFSEDQKRIAPRLMREAIDGGWGERRGRDGHNGRRAAMMMEHGGGMGPGPRGPAQQ
ncbi:Spy/CpxP family protein refolding chaperone [Microvirga calopogonii]|uniref:Spy/CpxP family protein refolding chaperone n=1 Tax=Microvirga calopogonii TaxID=2078013 RepID=UPI000E0D4AF7|nr:Spy/CpxP family protein refolding chaperone [Microvirga calopogonii]